MFRRRKRREQTAAKLNTYSYYRTSNTSRGNPKDPAKQGVSRLLRAVRPHFSVFRVLVVATGVLFAFLLLSADTTPIIRFTSSGVNARDTDLYRSGSKDVIESSIFNRTKLTFDYRGVEEALKVKFPEIESFSISFDVIGRKPVVRMSIHKPTYLFSSNGTSWAIDDRGVAIGRQEDLKDSFTSPLLTITDELGTKADIGDTLISPSQVSFLTKLVALLSKQQAIVEAIYVPLGPKQLDIILRDESWRYKLNSEGDPTLQAGTILAARATLTANRATPSEYVDIRVPEKVYWK